MALTDEDKAWFHRTLTESQDALEKRMTAADNAVEQRMLAALERVETSLLTEFHKWASPMEARQRSHAAALKALDAEMEALSDKVKNLEQRPRA